MTAGTEFVHQSAEADRSADAGRSVAAPAVGRSASAERWSTVSSAPRSRPHGSARLSRFSPRVAWFSGRYALEYAAFRLAAILFRSLGLERASDLSGALWRWIAPRSKRHPRALAHLASAFPDRSAAERDAIARGMWENLGRTFAEAFFLEEIARGGRVAYEGLDVFEAWASAPGGKVACAGHLANWELAISGIADRGLRPWSIYQKIKNPRVDRRVAGMRAFLYTGGLVPKNPALPRQFLRLIRDGGTVGFLADLRDHGGIPVPFFGRPAPSTPFPALLAHDAGTPILVTTMRRLPGVRFVQNYELVPLAATGDRRRDIAATTAEVQAALERFIRQWPDQWMWAHRRWG